MLHDLALAMASSPTPHNFPETRWSLVLNAQQDDAQALAELCQRYWRPLYAYARRMGLKTEDAEDLTQSFFVRLLSNQALTQAQAGRGKLRSFLLTGLRNFSTEEWRRSQTQKRGGGQEFVTIDTGEVEQWLDKSLADETTPDLEFDRCWARDLMEGARGKLAEIYEAAGNGRLFKAVSGQIDAEAESRDYVDVGAELGISADSARFAAFKLRQRFREQLRSAVMETVTTQTEVEEELHYLMNLFAKD